MRRQFARPLPSIGRETLLADENEDVVVGAVAAQSILHPVATGIRSIEDHLQDPSIGLFTDSLVARNCSASKLSIGSEC